MVQANGSRVQNASKFNRLSMPLDSIPLNLKTVGADPGPLNTDGYGRKMILALRQAINVLFVQHEKVTL